MVKGFFFHHELECVIHTCSYGTYNSMCDSYRQTPGASNSSGGKGWGKGINVCE